MSKELELIAEHALTYCIDDEGRCSCGYWLDASDDPSQERIRRMHASHVVSKLSEHGYSIVQLPKPTMKCQVKFPLSDPALLCQRDSGHTGGHEALDASCDRFRWPNLAAAAAAEEDQ